MKRILTSAAAVVFAAIALAGCGDDDDGNPAEGAASDATVVQDAERVTLIATDFEFDKTEVKSSAAVQITFALRNEAETTKHNLTIEALDVDIDADAGQTAEKSTEPDAGSYDYFCEYHPSAMKGTLIVS